jgi:glycosyltransferase involved in cell wall biosynthesis
MGLYASSGRRRLLPPLVFGAGALRHLLRYGRRYDVVHTASFPYFSLLAAAAARRGGRYRLLVDWHEIWTRPYWLDYAGPIAGRLGWWVQQACVRVRQEAFCFSRLHERRLAELGMTGAVTRLEGQYAGPAPSGPPEQARPVVVFAGRLIPEKRATAVVEAVARGRREIPDLEGEIYGDGPEHERVLRAIAEHGLEGHVRAPGFVDAETLERARKTALCLVLPSSREGYGLVVVEATAGGVPVVVVEGPDNAAVELVEEGVNGFVASEVTGEAIADAIARVQAAGPELRSSTVAWYRANAERLSLGSSLDVVVAAYVGDASARS